MAPNTVAIATDPLLAENMICKLHHDTSSSRSDADCSGDPGENSNQPVLSPSATSYVSEVGKSLNAAATAAKETVSETEQSAVATIAKETVSETKQSTAAEDVRKKVNIVPAGDFFAEVPTHMKAEMSYGSQVEAESAVRVEAESARRIEFGSAGIQEETVLKEAEQTQDLMSRLVESNMSPNLPAESSFFDNVLHKPSEKETREKTPAQPEIQTADPKRKNEAGYPGLFDFSLLGKHKVAASLALLGIGLTCLLLIFGQPFPSGPADNKSQLGSKQCTSIS